MSRVCVCVCLLASRPGFENSATGTRTRVARVRAEYPNQLDYSGVCVHVVGFEAVVVRVWFVVVCAGGVCK